MNYGFFPSSDLSCGGRGWAPWDDAWGGRGGNLFVRARRRRSADDTESPCAPVAGSAGVGGRVARRTVPDIGRVTSDQAP